MLKDGVLSIIENFSQIKKINIEDVFLFPENTLFFYYVLCSNGGFDNKQITYFEEACLGDPSERFYTFVGDKDESLKNFFKYIKGLKMVDSSFIKEPNDLLMLPQIWDFYDAFSVEALKLMFDKKEALNFLKKAKHKFAFFVMKNADYEKIIAKILSLDYLTTITAFLLFDVKISDYINSNKYIPMDIVTSNLKKILDSHNNALTQGFIYGNEYEFIRNMMDNYFMGKDVNSMLK